MELPDGICNNPFVKYSLKFFENEKMVEKFFSSNKTISKEQVIELNYKKHHFFERVNEEILIYLLKSNVN